MNARIAPLICCTLFGASHVHAQVAVKGTPPAAPVDMSRAFVAHLAFQAQR